jgi:hypothetical protein
MAAYQPLRDAFREWNRMIVDSAQFDKQHELNIADQRMKERQLESNLGLQAFNMKMAAARHELSKRGEQRAADSLDLQRSIHTQNKLQQQRAFERNNRKDKLAEEVHDVSLQSLKSQQILHEANAEKALFDTEEVQLDFGNVLGPEVLSNPDRMAELNKIANTRGYEIGPEGLALDADGSAFTVKRYAQAQEMPWLVGRLIESGDPHVEAANRISAIKSSRDELQSELKKVGDSGYHAHERAAMKREINKLNGEMAEERRFFTNPVTQSKHYLNKAETLRNAARAVASQGATNYANVLIAEADDYIARAKAMSPTSEKGNMVQLYNRDTGEGMGKASYNTATGTWKFDGQDYNSLKQIEGNPTSVKPTKETGGTGSGKGAMTQNQAMTLIERAHSTMNSKGVPILSGVLEPRLQSTRELVTKFMNEGADSMNAATAALEQVKAIETEWWDDHDWLKNYKGKGTPVQQKALASEINRMSIETKEPVRIKSKRMKDLVNEYKRLYKFSYRKKQRDMGIKNPYIPNATMRKIQQGMQ